mgnify:CR=1 FL=1
MGKKKIGLLERLGLFKNHKNDNAKNKEGDEIQAPADGSAVKDVRDGLVIGTVSKRNDMPARQHTVDVTYASVYREEPAFSRKGGRMTDRNGETLSRVNIRFPWDMEFAGYSLGGLFVKTLVPDRLLEDAPRTGVLHAQFNDSRPLELTGFRNGESVKVTIGQDRIGELTQAIGKCTAKYIAINTARRAKQAEAERGGKGPATVSHAVAAPQHRAPQTRSPQMAVPQPTSTPQRPSQPHIPAPKPPVPRQVPASSQAPRNHGSKPYNNQIIGNTHLGRDVKFPSPKVKIPYSSIKDIEQIVDKNGAPKQNRYGQILNSVSFELPQGTSVDGVDLSGFTAKVVSVDKFLDEAAKSGELQIMLNSRWDMKLSRDDGGRKTYVTIGRDKVCDLAGSIKEHVSGAPSRDVTVPVKGLDDLAADKNEEASLDANGSAAREAPERGESR